MNKARGTTQADASADYIPGKKDRNGVIPSTLAEQISSAQAETATWDKETIPAVEDVEPEWLINLKDSSLSNDTQTLGFTVRSILEDIKPDNWKLIDHRLASVDVAKAAPAHLLAVLSSLFTWREVLKEWGGLRDRALSHYQAQKIAGVDFAFKGLM